MEEQLDQLYEWLADLKAERAENPSRCLDRQVWDIERTIARLLGEEYYPSLEELEVELRDTIQRRDELADGGRYSLYDPDTANLHGSLTKQIEELKQNIARRKTGM